MLVAVISNRVLAFENCHMDPCLWWMKKGWGCDHCFEFCWFGDRQGGLVNLWTSHIGKQLLIALIVLFLMHYTSN